MTMRRRRTRRRMTMTRMMMRRRTTMRTMLQGVAARVGSPGGRRQSLRARAR
jgi:hypothetical protein